VSFKEGITAKPGSAPSDALQPHLTFKSKKAGVTWDSVAYHTCTFLLREGLLSKPYTKENQCEAGGGSTAEAIVPGLSK
jgi:hypothetical protein